MVPLCFGTAHGKDFWPDRTLGPPRAKQPFSMSSPHRSGEVPLFIDLHDRARPCAPVRERDDDLLTPLRLWAVHRIRPEVSTTNPENWYSSSAVFALRQTTDSLQARMLPGCLSSMHRSGHGTRFHIPRGSSTGSDLILAPDTAHPVGSADLAGEGRVGLERYDPFLISLECPDLEALPAACFRYGKPGLFEPPAHGINRFGSRQGEDLRLPQRAVENRGAYGRSKKVK